MMSMDLCATPSQGCMFGITLPRRKSQNVLESVVPVWSSAAKTPSFVRAVIAEIL